MANECWLEFHDSDVIALHFTPHAAQLDLNAYVCRWEGAGSTRRGTGWTQRVRLEVDQPLIEGAISALPAKLWSGRVQSSGLPVGDEGTLTLPSLVDAPATLEVETLVGQKLSLSGTQLRAFVEGEACFLETLPTDLDPELAADESAEPASS